MPIDRDEEKIKEFKENYQSLAAGEEVWFYDESGFKADMPPRRVWAKKGTKPTHYYRGNHINCNIMGAVSPDSGDFECLMVTGSDTETFQVFLNHLKLWTEGRRILLIQDNASWHKTKGLDWGNIVPIYLPPYAPDLNPIEELWKVVKDRLCEHIPPKSVEELYDRLQAIAKHFYESKDEIKSICRRSY